MANALISIPVKRYSGLSCSNPKEYCQNTISTAMQPLPHV
jgi:hypothetical protein